MQATTKRAQKGGEFGANGEWYEGGKFINTVPQNRKKEGSHAKKAVKQEIAPYVWEVSPEGKTSLYRQFAGAFGKVINGKAEYVGSEQILRYVGRTRQEAQDLLDKWNSGQRWI
jgi:hypothetical protein